MTGKSGSLFDETVQLTHLWLKELMQDLGWDDRHRAYLGLRVTLHALRDHLSVEAAAKLGAQLPMLVRGFYYDGWHPAHKPAKDKNVEAFLAAMEQGFRQSPTDQPIDPAAVATAVFRLLDRHVTQGECDHVRQSLPKALRALWSSGKAARPDIVPM
ncbi:MAG: DUF2267 domain-containing protein [Alphaproteobacteria bacterium]|nr:DUF2267 domain-containing protein [Alphaproteobacteria bacterium]